MTNPELPVLELTRQHWQAMLSHILQNLPEEACGLVTGSLLTTRPGWRSLAVLPITNMLHSPVRYELEPHEHLAALERIETQDWELAAIFHSHPTGPDHPSATDIAESYYPETIYLIWSTSLEGWVSKAFLIRESTYLETELRLVES